MPKTDFHERNAIRWGDALRKTLGAIPARTSIWVGDQDIMAVLENFMGANFNHAHLPTGGGFDYREVAPASERNCIEFKVEDKLVEIAKPERLVLWHFPESLRNSFLLLELAKLKPTAVYEDSSDSSPKSWWTWAGGAIATGRSGTTDFMVMTSMTEKNRCRIRPGLSRDG